MSSRAQRILLLVGVAVAAACSQDAGRMLPSGPSATHSDAASITGSSGWTTSTAAAAEPGFELGDVRGRKTVSGVGTVANLRGSCAPASGEAYISFVIQGVKVVTDENTEYFISADTDIDGGCGNLRNGTKVRVVAAATPNDDYSYTAESITIVDQPGGKPPSPVEGEGVVAALKGTCPSLTMVIHGYPVMTTSSTAFTGGDCEDIVPGTRVRVEGVLGGNSVVADTVEILAPAVP